jgi:hypothetical protein
MQTRFIAIQSARIFTGASAVAQVYPSPTEMQCNTLLDRGRSKRQVFRHDEL